MTVVTSLQRAIVAALTSALAACASFLPQPGGDMPHSQALPAERTFHESIDFTGRLSVRYQSGQKEEAVHGSFAWTQTPARATVTLLSPLGQTVAVIDATAQQATLTQSGRAPQIAANVDALTAEALGWPLPIAGLRSWLQGFAVGHAGRRFIASPAAEEVVTQEGWRIRYTNWQTDAALSAQPRPKRIDLARFTEQAGDVSIRIVIDTWQAH